MLWENILSAKLPVFSVDPDHIHIIKSPPDFYNTLLDRIRHAKKRIVLSTLYIGTGDMETKLVEAIEDVVRERNIQVLILLDASRGRRCSTLTVKFAGSNQLDAKHETSVQASTSCSLLAHLTSYPSVQVALYHNPNLRGLLNYFLPSRLNEVLGVQHIKAYVVDDSVIVSGANLSDEYFKRRQDRAWLFEDTAELANFYHGLAAVLNRFCYRLRPSGLLEAHSPDFDPIKVPLSLFKQRAHHAITDYITTLRNSYTPPDAPQRDTYVVPLVQLGTFNVRIEESFTVRLLSSLATNQSTFNVSLASGYFNLTNSYARLLFNLAQTRANHGLNFLCASPKANGFLHSRGMSGYIPMAYRESLIRLMSRFSTHKKHDCENRNPTPFFEFDRPNWTFHAKGLWVEDPLGPILTTIGSSNFSCRSLNRDLESQLVVWTRNKSLRNRIDDERTFLFHPSYHCQINLRTILTETHFRLPWFLRFVYPFFHTFL